MNCLSFLCSLADNQGCHGASTALFQKPELSLPSPLRCRIPIPVVTSDLSQSINPSNGKGSPLKWPHLYEVGITVSVPLPKAEEKFHIFTVSLVLYFRTNFCGSVFSPSELSWCLHSILVRCKSRSLFSYSLVMHLESVLASGRWWTLHSGRKCSKILISI